MLGSECREACDSFVRIACTFEKRPDLRIRRPNTEALRPGAANAALENCGGSGDPEVRTSDLLIQKARRDEWGPRKPRWPRRSEGQEAGRGRAILTDSPFGTAHTVLAVPA